MLSKEQRSSSIIPQEEFNVKSVNQFLKPFEDLVDMDIQKGMRLRFKIRAKQRTKKINPILKLAKPTDAKEIVEISDEAYEGTYPYKEMLDEEIVRTKIEGSNYKWFLFKDRLDKTMGCFKFYLDFKEKRGYLGGFTVKKAYQGRVDVVKAMIGMMIVMCSMYKKEIAMWYCENRTAHSSTQYMVSICGVKAVAFFPNKDVFFNKVESDLMQIIYNKKTLRKLRQNECPKIIKEVVNCFLYSNQRYRLGPVEFVAPKIKLDPKKITELQPNIEKKTERDKFGYETITFSLKKSDSYFNFLYTPTVQNFEKTEYKVNNLEELFIFVQEFKKSVREFDVRYCECFVSAYKPDHQQIFYDAGLTPRGYVPSWRYNKNFNVFEDQIVFNYYEGKISKDIKLIQEGIELLDALNISN